MLRRLPISLRFDDDDADFYYGFIEQKKNDRELSTLILDLLHIYYEDERVRTLVDNYVLNKSPYMHIHEELQRIALEHSRNSMSTSMLGDFTDNERKKVSQTSNTEVVNEEPQNSNEDENKEILMLREQVEVLTKRLDNLTGTSDYDKPFLTEEVHNVKPIVEPISSTASSPVIVPPVITSPTLKVEEKSTLEVVEKNEEVSLITNIESTGPKKPASFGKLLGSVK